MEWFKVPSEVKIKRCEDFIEFLKNNRINHRVNNNGYHIQLQVQHNFYPSKGTYYNSASGKKFHYKKFESSSELLKFLSKNVK